MKFTVQAIFTLLLAIFTGGLLSAQSQVELGIIDRSIRASADNLGMVEADIVEYEITGYHTSKRSGITHYYIRQTHKGVPIHNAVMGIHIDANGELFTMNNQFLNNIESKINTEQPTLDARTAIMRVAQTMNYDQSELPRLEEIKSTSHSRQQTFTKGSISHEDIPVQLMYQPMEDGTLRLCWDMSIAETKTPDWWSMRVDAQTGEILHKNNWTSYCQFGDVECAEEGHVHHHAPNVNIETSLNQPDSYRVFPEPIESPIHGSRQLVVNPADAVASPFGWHDTNGAAGAEYTITRGNNVLAMEDANGNNGTGFSPNGGASLDFDFALNPGTNPNNDPNRSAGITNLFYWNNLIHDVWYQYGFDEASGNFQENNYGRGGLGGDYVFADAQDGSGVNNANFSSPPDGSNGRIQMFLFTTANPQIDGSFDNVVIAHEYGHGISYRLVGGPANANCLSNSEQMGEGWSDWFGLIMTIEPGDTRTDFRTVGTYVLNQPTTGSGVRPYPYTTDMTANPDVHTDISAGGSYDIGTVWCAMLWEMTWDLIDTYGFDADLHNGTGGNNIAMALVIESLKLTPCSPGMLDARDALLQADQALYNGANECLIRKAFARRGLGDNASQGSVNSASDATNDFIADCELVTCAGVDLDINFDGAPTQTSWEITDTNGNVVASSGGNTYGAGLANSNLPLPDITCLPDGCYDLTFFDTANDGMCPRRTSTVLTGINIASIGLGGVFNGIPRMGQMCGNYTLTDANGTVLASGGGRFGTSETSNFCIANGVAELIYNPSDINDLFQKNNNMITSEMIVRPNVATDQITLSHTIEKGQTLQWTIIDMTGKIIRQQTFDSNRRQIDINVSNLTPGFYFMQLTDEQLILTKKFIKN